MDPLQQAKSLFLRALEHHEKQQLQEAEQLYRDALALAPDRISILTNLSATLISAGRPEQAEPLCRRVLELEPGHAIALDHLRACRVVETGSDSLCRDLERRLADAPGDPHLLNAYALALMDAGSSGEAAKALRQAIELAPTNPGLLVNLALATEAAGTAEEAIAHYVAALQLQPDLDAAGQGFARLLLESGIPGHIEPDRLDALLVQALRTPWIRPQSLVAMVTERLLRKPALQDCMHGEYGILGGKETLPGLSPALHALAAEPLLSALLECALIADPRLERIMTACRAALLHQAMDPARAPHPRSRGSIRLAFTASLAMQSFHNGYAYGVTEQENGLASALRKQVETALDAGMPPEPLALATLACYMPLAALDGSHRLRHACIDPEVPRPLLRQQLEQPMIEAALRTGLHRLTPINDAVSRKVRAQYEHHPYPRWSGLPRQTHKVPLYRFIRRHVAGISDLDLPAGGSGRLRVLNAGCGSGQHPIDLMLRVQDLDMLAIDLSAASLSYASRMASDHGVQGIRFAQADILELGSIPDRFDLIDSAGVLHHLRSPQQGLSVLRELLVPRGIFRIALYSERARRSVVACRAQIAEFGYPTTDDGIRRLRQHVLALPADHPAKGVTRFSDFYSMQECRDLLFHVQEHRFTLPMIQALLAEHDLKLIGLQLQPWQRAGFLAHFGDRADLQSLEQWDAYEREYPDTFADMFVLWTQAGA